MTSNSDDFFGTSDGSDTNYNQNQPEWSDTDDWEALSAQNPDNFASYTSSTTFVDSNDMAYPAHISILPDNYGDDTTSSDTPVATAEDIWLHQVIDEFIQDPVSTTPLYDTQILDEENPSDLTKASSQKKDKEQEQRDMEEHMAKEIAMLVRCNEVPEGILVDTGKAVEELTIAQKHDVGQLLVWNQHGDKWEASPFFRQAVAAMFHIHTSSKDDKENSDKTAAQSVFSMDAKAVSCWMTKSIGSELQSYTQRQSKGRGNQQVVTREQKSIQIGPHDTSVLIFISKYSTYGTGAIPLEGFQELYMDALVKSDSGRSLLSPPLSIKDEDVERRLERLQSQNGEHIRQIWRDLKNHDIVGPTEQEWLRNKDQLEEALQKTIAAKGTSAVGIVDTAKFIDECEILDFTYEPPPTTEQIAQGFDSKNNKYIRKSSHEEVQLAKDGKTPLYVDEGKFVFIDEESCIGCMQCVNVAPSSFLMLEGGRARTFEQRQGPDVQGGVAACPVSCMHYVSFDELKELETVRDKGDGRDDHRHMGHRRGHTPLHVAGIDSDNNHRSSWYHRMKNKCDNDGQCPQRGCFDCPSYRAAGENPFFQKKAKAAIHTRAQHFIDSGDVDLWRKTEEL